MNHAAVNFLAALTGIPPHALARMIRRARRGRRTSVRLPRRPRVFRGHW